MQSKINSFFKPNSSSTLQNQSVDLFKNLSDEEEEEDFTKEPEVPIIYTLQAPKINKYVSLLFP